MAHAVVTRAKNHERMGVSALQVQIAITFLSPQAPQVCNACGRCAIDSENPEQVTFGPMPVLRIALPLRLGPSTEDDEDFVLLRCKGVSH